MDPKQHTMSTTLCPACGDGQGCKLPGSLAMDGLSLDNFWYAHGHWSQATFGADGLRGPRGPLKHLLKELLREVLPAVNEGSVFLSPDVFLEEFCDLILLIFDATRRAGFTLDMVREACCRKLKKNMARKWPPIGNLHEPIEHFRGKGEPAHDDVDGQTELWAITDAQCDPEDTDGIMRAAVKMIDRLQDKFRRSPVRVVKMPDHLAGIGALQLALDQLKAMRMLALGYMTADDKRVLEATIANCERELTGMHELRRRASSAAVSVQPPPRAVDGPDVHDLVCEDMQARKRLGIGKYGQPLRVNDGRTTLIDYYQELLDAAAYCKKELLQRGIDHAPEPE